MALFTARFQTARSDGASNPNAAGDEIKDGNLIRGMRYGIISSDESVNQLFNARMIFFVDAANAECVCLFHSLRVIVHERDKLGHIL